MAMHAAVATTSKGKIDTIRVKTEDPTENEVLIKVSYAAMIAFDGYVADQGFAINEYPMILGFSVAGTVKKLGSGINDLKVGDRVVAYAFGNSKNKALQQYVVQPRIVCAKIPDDLPLYEAVTIPDNYVCAFYTLFNQLSLPIPTSFPAESAPPLASTPILIYGAGSTAGLFAVQLLRIAGYRNVIAIASGGHHDYLKSLGATSTFDYKSPTLVEDVAAVVGGDGKVPLAVDCITAEETLKTVANLVGPNSLVAVLLPVKEGKNVTAHSETQMYMEIPQGINPFHESTKVVCVRTFLYQQDEVLKEKLMAEFLPKLLSAGLLKPTPVILLQKDTLQERVEAGLEMLRTNQVKGAKVIIKVD